MATGRPTKLTPEVQETICRYLASGCYIETACTLAGICQATFFNWKERGEAGEQPFLDFVEATTRAEAQAELRAIAHIQKAGQEDPRHLEWWLERKFSARWGRRERHDLSGQLDVNAKLNGNLYIVGFGEAGDDPPGGHGTEGDGPAGDIPEE